MKSQKVFVEVIKEIFNQEPEVEVCMYILEHLYGIKAGNA
jgi:hypothetical protein